MIKINTLRALKECGVVAVVRGNSKEVGVEISKACVKGGVKALEVTYTNKFANDIIKELCEIYEEKLQIKQRLNYDLLYDFWR